MGGSCAQLHWHPAATSPWQSDIGLRCTARLTSALWLPSCFQDLLACSDEEVARALCERTHASLYRALADAGMPYDKARCAALLCHGGRCMYAACIGARGQRLLGASQAFGWRSCCIVAPAAVGNAVPSPIHQLPLPLPPCATGVQQPGRQQ